MDAEQETELLKKVNDIHLLLAGSNYDKTTGLVHRFDKVEKYIENDKRFKNRIAGGVAVGTPIAVILWDYIKTKLHF